MNKALYQYCTYLNFRDVFHGPMGSHESTLTWRFHCGFESSITFGSNKLIDATLTYLDCTWPPHDFHRPPKCPRESSKMVLELLQTISVNCCHFDDTDDRIRLILETWTKISHHSSWIRAIKGRFWYKGESSPKSAHFWNVLCLYHTTHGYIPKSTGKYWTCVFTNNDFCHSDSILL